MSSKKHRKQLRRLHDQMALANSPVYSSDGKIRKPGNDDNDNLDILEKLKNFSAIIHEIQSEPIKLGVPLEVTIQIGADEPQKKRLVYATLYLSEFGHSVDHHMSDIKKLNIDHQTKTIKAPRISDQNLASPMVLVLYPAPMGGYMMVPMCAFSWFGKEKIIVSEIIERPDYNRFINTPSYEVANMIITGRLIGHQLDGAEIFREELQATD